MTTRANRVFGVVVGGIIVLALVAAVFSATRPVTTRDIGTPDGTVQAYVSAVLDRNYDKAGTFLAPSCPCDVHDLDRAFVPHSARVDLVSSEINGADARVDVRVTGPADGGPFESVTPQDATFRLTRSGQRRLLVGSPWPLFDCAGA